MIQARRALKGGRPVFHSGVQLRRRRWNCKNSAPASRHLARAKSFMGSPGFLFLSLIEEIDLQQQAQIFEPQMNFPVAVVCVVAATPPVIYWVRFFLGVQKRTKAREAEEKARQDRINKLVGGSADSLHDSDQSEL